MRKNNKGFFNKYTVDKYLYIYQNTHFSSNMLHAGIVQPWYLSTV